MLISYAHHFVFIKTVKTAGTSVEGFLEPFCCPPGHQVSHWTPTLTSDYGVVGRRWPTNDCEDFGYFNHMSAAEIQLKFEKFNQFTRITSVRNPYDRAVSMFHYSHESWRPLGGIPLDQAIDMVSRSRIKELQEQFLSFVSQSYSDDSHLLMIDGKLAVDRWIRYENLEADLQQLVDDLKLPFFGNVKESLPTFKRNRYGRSDAPPLQAYLSHDALNLINQRCSWSFSTFGYKMQHSV